MVEWGSCSGCVRRFAGDAACDVGVLGMQEVEATVPRDVSDYDERLGLLDLFSWRCQR